MPFSTGDRQIQLKPKCFQCLQKFCRDRLLALPASSRYCCKASVQEHINKEIECARFQHLGSAFVKLCHVHKSDWNICVNLVLDDLCEGCESWPEKYDVAALFTPILNHGRIIRPTPTHRDKSTPVVPTARPNVCAQDPSCGSHGKSRAVHVGNYTMPAYVAKQWKLIVDSPEFDASLFSPSCGPGMRAPHNNSCTVQLSQLDLRNQECQTHQNCSQTYLSMLDLADLFNQRPEFDPALTFTWE